MPTAVDTRAYAGQWVAQDKEGDIIAVAPDLEQLEKALLAAGFSEGKFPAIMRIPDKGSDSLLL
jgi:hypothetical protein